MTAKHTCNKQRPGKPLPFGRRDPQGKCPRCQELEGGAEPRTLPWADEAGRTKYYDSQRAQAITAHFAPGGPHARGACGTVCTFADS